MTIYVINPNSSAAMTAGIESAIAPVVPRGMNVRCLTLAEGPPGIETDEHVADAAQNVALCVETLPDARAVIVACFSDPGVASLRLRAPYPVIGIREAAARHAMRCGDRFGVIAIGAASVPRHLAAFSALGVSDRVAGDRPLGLGVTDLLDPGKTRARMIEVAKTLRDADGADVLILGCAGMPHYRDIVEDATGLPVIEPCQAAVVAALEKISLTKMSNSEVPNA